MPNSVDSRREDYGELAGGLEVNNPEAVRKALKEIILPDVSNSSSGSASPASDLPTLVAPTAGGLSLETLARMIGNERTQATMTAWPPSKLRRGARRGQPE